MHPPRRLFSVLILAICLSLSVPVTFAQDCTDLPDAASYADRGAIAYEQKLYEDTLLDYTCAIALETDPLTLAGYYNERGSAHYWLQQDAEANADYSTVIELDPSAGYAYNNLANLYANIGDYELALEYYTLSLELGNGDQLEIAYVNRSSIHISMGNYDLAAEDIQAAVEINGDYADAYLYRGWMFALRNLTVEAADDYARWLMMTRLSEREPAYVANRSYITRITDGEVESIAIELNAGDVFSARASATDGDQRVDPLMVLFSPDGDTLIADDDSGINLDAVISGYVAEESGVYTLWLGNGGGFYYSGVDGQVNLSLERVRADGEVIEVVAAPTPVATAEGTEVVEVEELQEVEVTEEISFATYRLFANQRAEVYTTEGDRLNLRAGPGLRFDILGKLDKGSLVTLLEGPYKQDGLAWWRVRAEDGSEGWAVERVDEEQTLQLALVVGEDAVVVTTDGDTLNVRSGAGRANDIVVQLPNGATVTLLEVAPELVDGFQWWRVRLPDGREGWTIDRIEGERTLKPAQEIEGQG